MTELMRRLALLEQQVTTNTEALQRRNLALAEVAELKRQMEKLEVELRLQKQPIVDTRVLTRPKEFDGTREKFKDWADKLKAFIGAVSEEMLKLIERQEEAEAERQRAEAVGRSRAAEASAAVEQGGVSQKAKSIVDKYGRSSYDARIAHQTLEAKRKEMV